VALCRAQQTVEEEVESYLDHIPHFARLRTYNVLPSLLLSFLQKLQGYAGSGQPPLPVTVQAHCPRQPSAPYTESKLPPLPRDAVPHEIGCTLLI